MNTELDSRLVKIVPSERQLAHQSLEFYAFVHFTVNTFTDKEWGDGTEAPAIFNPTKFDATQWVDAIKAAGMKGLILTCKHHDGFCLWQSAYTEHSVKNSPWKNGGGDIVHEVSQACKNAGIKFGVYLSPWDRNSALYGQGKAYDDYFVNQLTELLSNYGEVFSVWFDGACGEGANGKKQYYDWERYYETIRKLQPNACISVCGPDVRWCGNEAGNTRQSEWSVVPARTRDTEKIASKSQQSDDTEFRGRKIAAQDMDLGSREVLKDEENLVWYAAEVNTSIRPGWFYHEYEDDKVKPLSELASVYEKSVGGNATFLLNIPPTREGLFHANDVARLKELGEYLQKTYGKNLLDDAQISCDEVRQDDYKTFFQATEKTCTIDINWKNEVCINRIVLKENILKSQRIESFCVDALLGDGSSEEWKTLYNGTTVGYKKIVPLENVKTKALKIRILDSRVAAILAFVGVY